MSRTIDADVTLIRNAVYGKDVREAIASGLEETYDAAEVFKADAAASATAAAASATAAAGSAGAAEYQLGDLQKGGGSFATAGTDSSGSATNAANVIGSAPVIGSVNSWHYIYCDLNGIDNSLAKWTIATRTTTSSTYVNYLAVDSDGNIVAKDNTLKPAVTGYVTYTDLQLPAAAVGLYVFYYSTKTGMAIEYKLPGKVGESQRGLRDALAIADAGGADLGMTWEGGRWNPNTGAAVDDRPAYVRTGYLPDAVFALKVENGFNARIYCFDASDVYLGVWAGAGIALGFSAGDDVQVPLTDADLQPLKAQGWKLKLDLRKDDGTDDVAVTDAENITFFAAFAGFLASDGEAWS